jgi:aminopeptidase
MLNEKQLDRYADILLWGLKISRKKKIKTTDTVMIRYDLGALKLAEKIYEKILLEGRNPVHRLLQTTVMERRFYEIAGKRQLTFIPPGDEALYSNLNGSIVLIAPESITHLAHIDPATIATSLKARKPLRDILDKREEEGNFSWTLGMYPTEALAKHAGMDLNDYIDQVVKACFLNSSDPVSQWESVYNKAAFIKKRLNRLPINTLHIESDNIDLVIRQGEKRRWIGISGHNIPSFELFVSPDWRGTTGVFYADQPSYRSGNLVEKIKVVFEKGKVVEAHAQQGNEFLLKQLEMDAGAKKIGEFSLTDKTFSRIDRFMANTLYDENYGGKFGNCHIALGSSYSDTYDGDPRQLTGEIKKKLGFNDSALHWDIVNTEKKRVTAHLEGGGKVVIYENGEFTSE